MWAMDGINNVFSLSLSGFSCITSNAFQFAQCEAESAVFGSVEFCICFNLIHRALPTWISDKSAVSTFYSHAYFSTTTNSYTRREHLSICNGSSNSNSSSGTGTYRLSMLTSNSTSNKFFLVFLLIKTHHALDIHGICTEGDGKKDLDVVYINSH